ncbi:MFS transporter permease [Pseudohalioglobus sediminis]|uniref:MFS transporter permease n=1 Tax=Pseudohalioglobus sediminis TaxID=2606449 RepID=A0A5B0X205_9GAMM|nr:MFS transporter [Pseudohalioglobus sediminis]KAA1192577.1 MFS transporter permease [Pseudohalioglobus sediminis]
MSKDPSETIYTLLVEDEDARVCRDIPDDACSEQPSAFVRQLLAQTLTKIGDALTSSRLVLAWMLSSIGSPPVFISLLVPLRESLSLLPQLFIAQWIREHAVRKWFWVAGSVGQALALIAMVVALLTLPGNIAAPTIVFLLALFSLSRGVCSVAAKDVLGKTISKSRRGRLTGMAASSAGMVTLGVAITLLVFSSSGSAPADQADTWLFALLLGSAALLWLAAAAIYAGIPEVPGATEGGGNAFSEAIKSLTLLTTDRDLLHFVLARMLLVATAFAIPYIVVIIQQGGNGGVSKLMWLLLAEGAAGLLSGSLWGRWSDSSSHHVMAAAAGLCALVIAAALLCIWLAPDALSQAVVAGGLIFTAAVAHQGARVGRKTYLVDLATAENRSSYTAVSNTVIGLFLLSGGLLGVVDTLYGVSTVLMLLLGTCLAAIALCLSLKPVD